MSDNLQPGVQIVPGVGEAEVSPGQKIVSDTSTNPDVDTPTVVSDTPVPDAVETTPPVGEAEVNPTGTVQSDHP